MLYLASALSRLPGVEVTILNEFPQITKQQLANFFGISLEKVGFRPVSKSTRALRNLVDGADFFIPQSNFRRVRAKPKNYIQILQVPYGPITPVSITGRLLRGELKEAAKDALRAKLLSDSRKRARITLSNSLFVHDTLLRNFKLDSELLYAPVQDLLKEGVPKSRMILSVGRFFRGMYNDKRYDILTAAFRKVSPKLPGWEYHLVGSVSPDRKSQEFIRELRRENHDFPVFFHVNVTHETLRDLYNQATIYWHGAGFGTDEVRHPESTEHFGMSVLEAMTTGCIPIVVDKGGLKETVTHGENGFLWRTMDELAEHTLRIVGMPSEEISSLQRNARLRYSAFSTASFEKRVSEIFLPLIV